MRWTKAVRVAAVLACLGLATGAILLSDLRCGPQVKEFASELEPLDTTSAQIRLPVPGFEPAMVSVPLGATKPRPIVIVLHGEADRPEPHCEVWRKITEGSTFVLCPRGVALPGQPSGKQLYSFDEKTKTHEELSAALQALKSRFTRYVAQGAVVLVGVGESVTRVLDIMQQDPTFFRRVVLLGGKQEGWSSTHAASFARRGGSRVLFACMDPTCTKLASRNVLFAQRAGADAVSIEAPGGAEPGYGDALAKQWKWLTEGDARFTK